jgi:hypothetical protein
VVVVQAMTETVVTAVVAADQVDRLGFSVTCQ